MEKAKTSKKKACHRNRKSDNRGSDKKSSADWRVTETNDNSYDNERSLRQPSSRLTDLDEIWQETNIGQDFQTLADVPITTDSHFIFKSEKNWSLDASKYDDFFSVDVKCLATVVQCIPFNQYVQVDDRYFTKDELTGINNTAEQGKKAYQLMVQSLTKANTADAGDARLQENVEKCDEQSKNAQEDLDFLLSLKEPVRTRPVLVGPKSTPEESKTKTVPAATKSIDLEKWLDLVLED